MDETCGAILCVCAPVGQNIPHSATPIAPPSAKFITTSCRIDRKSNKFTYDHWFYSIHLTISFAAENQACDLETSYKHDDNTVCNILAYLSLTV